MSLSSIVPVTQSEHEFSLWHAASATPAESLGAPQSGPRFAAKPVKRVTFGAVTIVEITPRNFLDSSATLDSLPSPTESDTTPEMIDDDGDERTIAEATHSPGDAPALAEHATTAAILNKLQHPALPVLVQSGSLPVTFVGSSSSETIDPASEVAQTPLRQEAVYHPIIEPRTTPRAVVIDSSSSGTEDSSDVQLRKCESLQFFLKSLREAQDLAINAGTDEAQRDCVLTPSLTHEVPRPSLLIVSSISTSAVTNDANHSPENCAQTVQSATIDPATPSSFSANLGEEPLVTRCAFCNQSSDCSDLVFQSPHYFHVNCALWSPEVCGDPLTNTLLHVDEAVKRGAQIKCAFCRQKGATIGCVLASCQRSYHFKCAVECGASLRTPAFELKCPKHSKSPAKRPREEAAQQHRSRIDA